jgi:hypothetical protein
MKERCRLFNNFWTAMHRWIQKVVMIFYTSTMTLMVLQVADMNLRSVQRVSWHMRMWHDFCYNMAPIPMWPTEVTLDSAT